MLAAVIPTQGKRALVALAFTLFAVASCTGASSPISAGAAAPNPPAKAAPQPGPGEVESASSGQSIGSQVLAAIKAAEAEPHGDIGDPALAQAP